MAVETSSAAFARLIRTVDHIGTLVAVAGWNYAAADDPEASGQMPTPRGGSDSIELPPSAVGSHEGEPWGWPMLVDVVGNIWPNGDTGNLRKAAVGGRRRLRGSRHRPFTSRMQSS